MPDAPAGLSDRSDCYYLLKNPPKTKKQDINIILLIQGDIGILSFAFALSG